MLDAFKQFFTNETVREQAWEATKAGASAASEYLPEAKTVLTAAAVIVGGAAVLGGGVVAHRRGHLARVTPDANTFTRDRWLKRTTPHQSGATIKHTDTSSVGSGTPDALIVASTSSAQGQGEDEVARHTRSHDRQEGEHSDSKSRSRSPSPSRRTSNDQ